MGQAGGYMRISIKDYGDIDSIIPSIEGDEMWTISILFNDNTYMVYGYLDKKEFTKDYKELLSNMEGR